MKILLLLVAATACAQTYPSRPVTYKAGTYFCGIRLYTATQLQNYCYVGTTVKENGLHDLEDGAGLSITNLRCPAVLNTDGTCSVPQDEITWVIKQTAGVVTYSICTSAGVNRKDIPLSAQ